MLIRWINRVLALLLLGLLPPTEMTRDSMRAVIPDSLIECYRNQRLVVKDNLLPMSIPVLIDLIRKVESYQGLNMDMRTLATVLLQRFRIDGIERDPDVMPNDYVIPYKPSGSEFYKFRFLMDTLIPTQTYTFPNDSLTMIEQCTLHWMLSSSVDRWMRGDESSVCNNRLSNYPDWGSRIRREAKPAPVQPDAKQQQGQPINPDAEVLDPSAMAQNDMPRRLNAGFQTYQSFRGAGSADYPLSACPIENGVVYSKYGPVKVGVVLAGIAAGLQPQIVSQQNLLQAMKLGAFSAGRPQTPPPRGFPSGGAGYPGGGGGYPGGGGGYPGGGGYQGRNDYSVNNIWAATLSGELAEVAILQGPAYGQSMRIGLSGSWNSTLTPRYYFLSEENKDALTETDIRGGIDGLLIGKNVMDWNRMANGGLRLSQLLELYYSELGVFDQNNRACKRKDRFTQIAPLNDLQRESESFARVLQYEQPSAVNQAPEAISEFSQIAVSKLSSTVSSLVEPKCTDVSGTQQSTFISRTAADLYLIIDCSWDFKMIQNVLSNIVDKCDVNKYGSRVTLLNGKDGSVLVNTTQHMSHFYQNFNSTAYNMYTRGFDLGRSLKVLQERIEIEMNSQRQSTSRYQQNKYYDNYQDPYQNYYNRQQVNYYGSSVISNLPRVVVFVPSMNAGPGSGDGDSNYIRNKITYYRTYLPDVKLLYFVSGSKERYTQYTNYPNKDIFILAASTDSSVSSSVNPLVARIAEIPQPIINPTCGSTWVGRSYSAVQINAYLLPNTIQYYRIHPNYFYKSNDARIKVQSQSSGTLTVCQSRTNPQPNGNRSQGMNDGGETKCKQITSDTYEIRIGEGSCGDNYAYQCHPYYISVSAPQSSSVNFNCREEECRYPNMIKYTLSHEGLSCYSGVANIISNPLMVIILVVVSIKDYI